MFEHAGPRLVLFDGITVEAPLDGTLVVIHNSDQPGVIGEVGTVLGHHKINIETFALGRGPAGAVAVVKIDSVGGTGGQVTPEVLTEIQAVNAVQQATIVTL